MAKIEIGVLQTSRGFTWIAFVHLAIVSVSVLSAIFLRLPDALILTAPSLIILLVGAASERLERPSMAVSVDRPRLIEGDDVRVTIEARCGSSVPALDIEFVPADDFHPKDRTRKLSSLAPGGVVRTEIVGTADRWGVVSLGGFLVTAKDRFLLTTIVTEYEMITRLRVHIHEERARTLSDPDQFRRLVGSHQSDERGEGCEIADVRPYQPGDRLQSLNWRISARNDEPWVTLRHPDRSTTVVLVVDAFAGRHDEQTESLRRTVRAVLGLARLHVAAQDPVGMMIVGSGVRWVPPGLGRAHLHQLTETLLDMTTDRWRDQPFSRTVIERSIPKDAVTIAISPLDDRRFTQVLENLRARGQSLAVIEPVTFWPDHFNLQRGGKDFVPRQAWRIYSLTAQAERRQLSDAGISVIPWEEGQPIESVLRALRMSRRARGAFR